MHAGGYVLVGGKSSRMGTDKALLPYRDTVLAAHVATQVLAAAGSVTLVGDPDRYAHLGYPVINDRVAGNGPLGGVAAAVQHCAEWALVVACDMPGVTTEFLSSLLETAASAGAYTECVVPRTESGIEPLCALYHRRALGLLDAHLNHKFLKMTDVVQSLQTIPVPSADLSLFCNLNTLEDLRAHE